MDCKLIEASESDLEFVRLDNERIMREKEKEVQDMIAYFEKMYENEDSECSICNTFKNENVR